MVAGDFGQATRHLRNLKDPLDKPFELEDLDTKLETVLEKRS
mgnify:CR=1 FL=1